MNNGLEEALRTAQLGDLPPEIDKDYKKVLDKLNAAEPNEVGDILKEYFRLKKRKNKK